MRGIRNLALLSKYPTLEYPTYKQRYIAPKRIYIEIIQLVKGLSENDLNIEILKY
jgi:hypothetical protein